MIRDGIVHSTISIYDSLAHSLNAKRRRHLFLVIRDLCVNEGVFELYFRFRIFRCIFLTGKARFIVHAQSKAYI